MLGKMVHLDLGKTHKGLVISSTGQQMTPANLLMNEVTLPKRRNSAYCGFNNFQRLPELGMDEQRGLGWFSGHHTNRHTRNTRRLTRLIGQFNGPNLGRAT